MNYILINIEYSILLHWWAYLSSLSDKKFSRYFRNKRHLWHICEYNLDSSIFSVEANLVFVSVNIIYNRNVILFRWGLQKLLKTYLRPYIWLRERVLPFMCMLRRDHTSYSLNKVKQNIKQKLLTHHRNVDHVFI